MKPNIQLSSISGGTDLNGCFALGNPIDRSLQIIGDRWTFLILREAFFGVRYYDQLLSNTEMATNILSNRLNRLVKHQILKSSKDTADGRRKVYKLTGKGLELYSVTLTLMQWGDRWLSGEEGPPLALFHKRCGHRLEPVMCFDHCKEVIDARDMTYTETYVEPDQAE